MARRSHRHRSRREAEDAAAYSRSWDWLGQLPRLGGWLLLGLFLLVIVVAPLPLGANRPWAWAPIVVVLGALAIPVALGLGDSAGFRVAENERWPLLALVVCTLLFAFVGILQLSPHAPATPSAVYYERARFLLGQAHDIVPTLTVMGTRDALLRGLGVVLVFVLARALFRDSNRARWLLYALLLSALLVMAYALLQQMRAGGCYVGLLLKKVGEYTNDRCLMSGTFVNSNSFGCFVGMAFAAALALLFQERSRRHSFDDEEDMEAEDGARYLRMLDGGTMTLAAIALLLIGAQLFSSSRAAFAATVVVTVGLIALSMRGRWRSRRQVMTTMALGAVLGVLVIGVAGGAMLRKVSLFGEVGANDRIAVWSSSLQAANASPWLGWGLGSFADIFTVYQPASIDKYNDKAHSTPLDFYVETGILIPMAVCLWGALGRRRHRYLLIAAIAVPGVAMLHSLVDFSLQMPAIAFISAAFLGMGWAQTFHRTHSHRPPVREAFTEDEE
jgi:O-antigen ligase